MIPCKRNGAESGVFSTDECQHGFRRKVTAKIFMQV